MVVSRFDDVINAIDNLIDDEVQTAPVRFPPNTLSDSEIEAFIDATMARGEFGGAEWDQTATPVAAPPVRTTRPAPRRVIEPRPNRYEGTCRVCQDTVPAGDGVLTRERGKWMVQHNTCPVAAPAPRRAAAPVVTTPAIEDAGNDTDCYVVSVEIEVVADGVRTAREAALLALREVFAGEVAVTVTDTRSNVHEVNVTV